MVTFAPVADDQKRCNIWPMLAATLLLLSAQDPQALSADLITVQEAADRFIRCGLGPVSIRWNDPHAGGEDILVATNVKSATDEQLKCVDKAISYYTIELPPEIQSRLDALRDERLAPIGQEQARSWLSDRGLLNRLPKYQRGATDDGAFTSQIEALCGPNAKGAFQSSYGFHVLSPEWVKRELASPEKSTEVLACLMNSTTAAGFDFGFIGNEQTGTG